MVTEIVTYNAFQEIADSLDKKIADVKSSLGEYLGGMDKIRNLAEKSKRIRDVVVKLSSSRSKFADSLGEVDVSGVKIFLDANASQELAAIELTVRSHQERLMVLQKAREAINQPLEQLGDTEGLKILSVETDGVPQQILLNVA